MIIVHLCIEKYGRKTDQLGPGIQKCEITKAMYEIIFNERI